VVNNRERIKEEEAIIVKFEKAGKKGQGPFMNGEGED